MKITNSLIHLLLLMIVSSCSNSVNVESGNSLKNDSSQYAIEGNDDTVKLLKRIVHRVKTDSDKLDRRNVVFEERYDSSGNKLTQYEKFDNYYISWNYSVQGFKRGYGESDDRRIVQKECEFIYDSHGKEVDTFIYHFSGWPSLFENKFNSDGSIAEKCEYRHYKLVRKNTYKYDCNGKEIEECCFNSKLYLDYKKIFGYDNDGRLSDIDVYNGRGNLERSILVEYEYY